MPKDLKRNVLFRYAIIKGCKEDPDVAQAVWEMCRDDILFFLNVFCYVFEPREKKVVPFITWDTFQDETILKLVGCVGKKDAVIEKSRDMGASWMMLSVFFWLWLFHDYSTIGLVSRTEDAVDKTDDPDTLMWKLDFHLKNLPWFLRPGMGQNDRAKLKLKNADNDSTIIGYSATGDVARGGRKLTFGMDELAAFKADDGYSAYASTQHVTESRIMLSTPQGAGGIFYEVANTDSPDIEVITLHWSIHPFKSKGLYTSKKVGDVYRIEVLDNDYEFPDDYEFILDGKPRSPWYDRECRRSPVKRLIAQELDIDYSGAGSQFFEDETINKAYESVQEARHVGFLEFTRDDMKPMEFHSSPGGPLKLWCNLVDDKPAKDRRYTLGADIATGKGGDQSSNSVAVVIDVQTGQKVAEYVAFGVPPERFAEACIALGRWFQGSQNEAYLIWEENGPGTTFTNVVLESGYGNYYRRVSETVAKKKIPKAGFWKTPNNEDRIFAAFSKAIDLGYYTERSEASVGEMRDYIYNGSRIVHIASIHSEDPAAAGENHGDRVVASMMAWEAVKDRPKPKEESKEIPKAEEDLRYTLYGRRKKANKKREEAMKW